MIQFYENEVGIDLIFPLTDSSGAVLTAVPSAGYPKLFVGGLATSPIVLTGTSIAGTFHHVITLNEFPILASEVVHYFECYIEWRSGSQIILSDAFLIAVIQKPSVAL